MKLSIYQGCGSVFIISVFRIRIGFKEADPDPAFQVNAGPDADSDADPDEDPDQDPWFDDQKFLQKIQVKNFFLFFYHKLQFIYPGPP